MQRKLRTLSTLALLAAAAAATAEAGLEDLVAEAVFSGLENPVWVTSDRDGALVVTLLPGIVRRRQGDGLDPRVVLDLQHRVRGGGGLHSVAFHPTRPWIFAHFAEVGSTDLVVSRFDLAGDPPRAQLATEAELVRAPKTFPLHYGGQLAFGPDGRLWISTGDGTRPGIPDPLCAAQSTASLEGKILRLDVDGGADAPPYYAIPEDNPYAAGGGAPEVWGVGLRNPWRFSFDRETGDLLVSDVGEEKREEVTRLAAGTGAGANFGWKVMEGTRCVSRLSGCAAALPACGAASYRLPLVEYGHRDGRCAVVGGFVYRGRLMPALYGRYLYGDFCSGELWAAADGGVEALPLRLPGVTSIGEDAAGELWLTAADGVYRLRDASLPAAGLVELEARAIAAVEGDGAVEVGVVRVGGATGGMRVRVSAAGASAAAGADFVATSLEVAWADGEAGRKSLQVPLIDDAAAEAVETFGVALELTAGDGVLGVRDRGTVTVRDDDACTPDATRLCLNRDRFEVSVTWRTAEGLEGEGKAVTLGPDSGSFWFFSDNNPEIFVKVLDACALAGFGNFWVFAAGLTDVGTSLRVLDTATGQERVYRRALGVSYEAVRDTAAFGGCP